MALSWRHTFDGLVSSEFLASLSAEQQAARHTRTFSKPETVYRVASVEGFGIIGFASGGPNRQADVFEGAELYAIYLRPEFERRGIGRALFEAVATELLGADPRGFYLTALSVNPNREFYQVMGGRVLDASDIQLGSQSYSQVGFVWKDSLAG